MKRFLLSSAIVTLAAAPLVAGGHSVNGSYVEARTAEVFTGACIMSSEAETMGKEAVLAWKVNRGSVNGISLDGLSIVAAVAGDKNLGIQEVGGGKAVTVSRNRSSRFCGVVTRGHSSGATAAGESVRTLSSFIAINQDGTVAAYCGKMDMGLGLHTAMGQIVVYDAGTFGSQVVDFGQPLGIVLGKRLVIHHVIVHAAADVAAVRRTAARSGPAPCDTPRSPGGRGSGRRRTAR